MFCIVLAFKIRRTDNDAEERKFTACEFIMEYLYSPGKPVATKRNKLN